MSKKRKRTSRRAVREKQENKVHFEISRRILAGIALVVTTALATILGQWVIDNYITPVDPILDVIEVMPPDDDGQLAMLAMIAGSPFVGNNEQQRFIVAGLEPYENGALSRIHIPAVDIPIRLVNTGNKATTANAFELTLYSSPSALTAPGFPLDQETQNVSLDVGESKDVTLHFEFKGLEEPNDIPEMPYTLTIDNPEYDRMMQLVVGDIEGNRINIPIQLQLGQNQPSHKLVSWVSVIEGREKPSFNIHAIAIEYFNPRTNHVFADNYAQLGDINYRQGAYDRAVIAQTIAIASDNQQPDYYFKRGNAYDEQGKLQQAIADYERAVELDAENWKAWSNMGYVYMRQENHEKAIEAFSTGISVAIEEPSLYKNLGAAYILAGRHEDAIEPLARASLLTPTDPETYYYLSVAYEGAGDIANAESSLEQAAQFGWSQDDNSETSASKYR